MKPIRTIVYSVAAAAIGIGALGLSATWAQDPEAKPDKVKVVAPNKNSYVPQPFVDQAAIQKTVDHALTIAGIHGPDSIQGKIRRAAEKLRDAKGSEAEGEAQEKLAALLGEYFDQDMARREQELAKLEERLGKLRAQLDHRREKRQDIIDLQIKVAVYEADGLGFLSQPSHGPFGWDFSFGDDHPAIHISSGDASMTVPVPMPHSSGDAAPSSEESEESDD